ncbi:peptidyl-prolyl cis-trans isomerase FKBP8-like [Dendronephthya gigantea]|uniref:peptidyl-prolyl cis-trans isomerase FKBP8-like n=1 Tax=Dendronephthya gigantea TaxID=151771 RepID=UPI001068F9BF|nr:peptidyl-prolyl cis-trans isomerase FKBP8-like [Dendronephthya gigantea]
MDSTVENAEKSADSLNEQSRKSAEVLAEEHGEIISEGGDEHASDAPKNLDGMSSSEVKVDSDTQTSGRNEENTEEEAVEVVEIEEKVIIETVDEGKHVEESPTNAEEERLNITETIETIDLPSEDETVTPASEPSSLERQGEPAELPQEAKKQDEWTDLLGNGLLRKKVIQAGKDGGSRPAAGQEVCIKTEGMLPNGDRFDLNEELKFIIGDGDVVTALDLCVPSMVENEICELVAAARFAYGELGREDDDEGDVPPDAEVTFKLELLSIMPGPDIANLTDEQRINLGDEKRERGNYLFRRDEYSLAVHSYTRALKYLGASTSEPIVELKIKCWNNISASHLKVKEYADAKKACDSVLEVDPDNVKALFRKGKVLYAQGEYEESVELLRKANTLDPDNRLIRKELYIVRQKFDDSREKERSMYQRMVSGFSGNAEADASSTFFTWPVILGATGIVIGGVVAALWLSRH